jgi:hypothetical protein
MGRGNGAYLNKMLHLKPLTVEYNWLTSFLGQSAGLTRYSGPVYEGDISFTTCHATVRKVAAQDNSLSE